MTDPPGPTALLAVRGRLDGVRSWARGGLLPVWVVPDVAWTLVVPAGPPSSRPPYDDPVAMLGGRPVPGRLRPALLLVADRDRAVLTVQAAGRGAQRRWLTWSRGVGLTDLPDLPRAPLGLLATLAGDADRGERSAALSSAVRGDGRSGAAVVEDLLRALGLPGAGLAVGAVRAGDLPGALRVEPDAQVVARFDAVVEQEAELTQDERGHDELGPDGRR
jgi:hypothetical protein